MEWQVLSLSALYALRQQIAGEVSRRETAQKVAATRQTQVLLREHGVRDATLTQTAVMKTPAAGKYQNPVDPTQTWSGRGRKPAWVQLYLDNGGTLEKLARR